MLKYIITLLLVSTQFIFACRDVGIINYKTLTIFSWIGAVILFFYSAKQYKNGSRIWILGTLPAMFIFSLILYISAMFMGWV